MKRHFLFAVIAVGLSLALFSCSELKKDLPSPVSGGTTIHPEGWDQPASAEFHGAYLKAEAKSYDTKECQPCHAANLNGGTSNTSCFQCHALYPHKAGWTQTSSANFHGMFLKATGYDAGECRTCHGAAYTGGTSGVSCFGCHATYPHGAQWMTGGAAGSHGLFLKGKNWNDTECQACHGADYSGGMSSVACFRCHDPYPHSVRFPSGRHTNYLYPNGYPLAVCRTCHGSDYSGGNTGVSCMQPGCHVDRNGVAKSPEACNTCHGVFRAPASDFLSSAPPKGVQGDTAQTYPGVGAHQKHLLTGDLGKPLKCQECHVVPTTLNQPGHIDTKLPADVVMQDTLAGLVTGNGAVHPLPSYDKVAQTCSRTYCHGTWMLRKSTSAYPWIYNPTDSVMVGNMTNAPNWTGGSAQAACGTCHGLPPQGHTAVLGACVNCHSDVVDANMQIIDQSKHINGQIDVLTVELPMR